MRAGFNWELGPFEMWDAAGVRETVARMKAMNLPVSPRCRIMLDSARVRIDAGIRPTAPQCY